MVSPATENSPTWPLCLEMLDITSPTNSLGNDTVTFKIGSSKIGFAFSIPALKANEAAILNEISFESTGW